MRLEDIPIVDTHHHLWNLDENYYPWLTDRITKRVCGEYAAIRKNYLVDDFKRDIADLRVVKTVHVQAEHDFSDPVRETKWLASVARTPHAQGIPHGIVAWADLAAPKLPEVLEAHCQAGNVIGIRQMCHEAYIQSGGRADQHARIPLQDKAWLLGVTRLKDYGLTFDLQFYHQQIEDAFKVVSTNPDQVFVITHALQPADRSAEGLALWQAALKRMAQLDNCVIKISGLGMFDRQWTTESLRPIILTVLESFGVARCMFGSNFPVDGMMSGYKRLWSAYHDALQGCSDTEIKALFAGNAEHIYGI